MKDQNRNFIYDKEEVKKGYVSTNLMKLIYNLNKTFHYANWFKALFSNKVNKIVNIEQIHRILTQI